ncbi:hypothetical protein KEM54_001115 [Ascosphaera aggregata]|nr:hypothetical protein KEM54_001115 [Ascosphaera aggregata]
MSAKAKDGHSDGGFHQEYIASLRYRNDLPPPEMPPNFLEIPHEGIERFLTPGFASSMMRREELNIDVDAEGGMSIDPVGIPGLHLGDESAILASENPPPIDQADAPLLMTLDQLRNPAPKNSNVSFLRRTQYITPTTAGVAKPVALSLSLSKTPTTTAPKRKASREDPPYIKKYIMKGFDIAYPQSQHTEADTESRIRGLPATKAEIDAWTKPTHPTNPKARPVGLYPLVPDLTGFNDTPGYVQLKFEKAPVPTINGARDDRMDVAIVVPSNPDESVVQEYESRKALHESNPKAYPDPGPQVPLDYDVYLPDGEGLTERIKEALNVGNPYRDDEENYTHERDNGTKSFKYNHLRTYSTSSVMFTVKDRQFRDLALVFFDPKEESKQNHSSTIPHRLTQKAAYYHPILTKSRIRPERARVLSQAGLSRSRGKVGIVADQLHLSLRDPNDQEVARRVEHRAQIDSKFAHTIPEQLQDEVIDDADDEKNDIKTQASDAGSMNDAASDYE